MRYILIFFVFMIYSIFSYSSEKYDYKKYWNEEKIQNINSEVVLYTKDSPLSYLKNIASITVSVNSKDNIEGVVSIIKKSIGSKKWSEDKIDGLRIYETVDVQSGVLFRLGVNEKTNQFSLASVKIRYLMPSYLEIHMIQVEKLTGLKSKTKSAFLYDLLFSKAYAQIVLKPVELSIQSLGQGILNETAVSLNNNAVATRGVGTDVRAGMDNFAGATKNAGTDVRAGLDNLSGTIKSTVNVENVAKLSAVAAFTSTLTSALTTFAINGTYSMFRTAYYQVIGQYPSEEQQIRVKRFEDSFTTFKNLSPVLSQLNMKLDIFSTVLDSITKEPTEVLLAKIEADIVRAKKGANEAGSECADCLKEKLIEIKSLEELKFFVQDKGVDVAEKKGMICHRLDNLYGSYIETELGINVARKSIIQDTQVFIGAVNDKTKVELAIQEKRMSANTCTADGSDFRIRSIKTKVEEEGCLANPSSPKAICQEYQGLLDKVEACEVAAGVSVSDDHRASLIRSAGSFSKNLAYFSRDLSQLDCSKYENGACIKAGPYLEIKEKIRSKLTQVANECPGRAFAAQLKNIKTKSQEPVTKIELEKSTENMLTKFLSLLKGNPANAAQAAAIRTQESTVTGEQ